ncbi:TOM70 [[Candida] zeylanoides]
MERSSFLSRNKVALTVAAVAGVSAGAYLYYSAAAPARDVRDARDATGAGAGAPAADADEAKGKTKKRKGKKKSDAAAAASGKPYPLGADGLPALTDDVIGALSAAEREAWAVALKEDGNHMFKAKRYEDSIAFYTAALQLHTNPVYYANRAACYAALNDHANVIKDTSAAIALKRDYTKCVLRRATSYEATGQYTDAMYDLTALTIYGGFNNKSVEQSLERVLKKHSVAIVEENLKNRVPELPSAATVCSFFGAFVREDAPEGLAEDSQSQGDQYLWRALQALDKATPEGYEEADTLLHQSVGAYGLDSLTKESPDAGRAAVALEYSAAFKFLKNDPTSATLDIERAINLKLRPRSFVLRALINADKSSFADANSDFDTAKKLDPNYPDIYYHLGQLFYLTGDLAQAEENFVRAKELNPQNMYAFIQLACIKYKNGDVAGADDMFTATKLKFPTSPVIPNYYGEILADRGEIEKACKQFDTASALQRAISSFSVGALPLINKASLLSREAPGDFDEVEALLTEACELDPKSELARIQLAQIKLQKEQVDEAIVLFEESSILARTFEEKVQATSFAEATKMQKRLKEDPVLSAKILEVMASKGL